MRVTCGSCFRALVVEDWLADNVARCPKCNEVIRIPPKGSADGANAVVLTVEEATELLRRRAAGSPDGKPPSPPGSAEPPPTGGPKTEPLPAFLKQASASIHAEPEQRKTRPLPKPVGRGSPGLGPVVPLPMPPSPEAAPLPPVERGFSPFRANPLTPLVPVAFVVGLLIGGACGWMIAQAGRNDKPAAREKPAAPADTADLPPDSTPAPPPAHTVDTNIAPTTTVPTDTATTTPPPTTAKAPPDNQLQPAPDFDKDAWLSEQPKGARATVSVVSVDRRVAAAGGQFPQTNLYYPAPLGFVYLDVKLKLKKATSEPVTFLLGGSKPDCWLVSQDGRTFDSMGRPVRDITGVADASATVALDDSADSAEVEVRFRVPSDLKPPVRVAFRKSQFAELPGEKLAEPDPLAGRDPANTAWARVPVQALAQDYSAQPIMAAIVKADAKHQLTIARQGDGYEVKIDQAGVSGTFKQSDRPGCLEGTLKLGQQEAKATIRLFDACRTLLIYFSDEPMMQFAYQRRQATTDWE